MADPGFPRDGKVICRKLHENERNWTEGGCSQRNLVSANAYGRLLQFGLRLQADKSGGCPFLAEIAWPATVWLVYWFLWLILSCLVRCLVRVTSEWYTSSRFTLPVKCHAHPLTIKLLGGCSTTNEFILTLRFRRKVISSKVKKWGLGAMKGSTKMIPTVSIKFKSKISFFFRLKAIYIKKI